MKWVISKRAEVGWKGLAWHIWAKLYSESHFILTHSIKLGMQGWWPETIENVEDLIPMIQWAGLFRGNLKGLKQIVDKSTKILKEAEGVHVKNLRKMRDAQQMSNRNNVSKSSWGACVQMCKVSAACASTWSSLELAHGVSSSSPSTSGIFQLCTVSKHH